MASDGLRVAADFAMSEAELLPEWSSPDGIVMSRSKATPAGDSSMRGLVKENTAWHSRIISNLIFFSIVIGIGAILGVIATVRYMASPEVMWLRSLEQNATAFEEEENMMPYPVDLSGLSDVYHDLSDEELLWRASVDGKRAKRGDGVAPKLAYLFLTRGPLPLAPLWERYFEGHEELYSIYIHAHPNFLPDSRPDSVFYRRNVPSKAVVWAKLSVLAAERRLLGNALLDAANERFVLVSESCVPLTPFPVAYQYFLESNQSFVESYIDPGPAGLGRYYRIKDPRKLNPEISPRQWRKGSQWVEMSRALALLVVADRQYYAKFESVLCLGDCGCYADEHYLPTLLTILAPSSLANRTTTFVEFLDPTDAHPFQWEAPDVSDANLKNITAGHNCSYNGVLTETCYLFARKFSPATIQPLLDFASATFGIP